MAAMSDLIAGIISRPIVCTALIIFLAALFFRLRTAKHIFPVVNAYRWDFTRRKAYATYLQDSKKLISDGLAKAGGPITLLTPSGPRIVLPSSHSSWVKDNKALSHQELVRHDFFADYPGFEANAAIHHPDHILIDTIKSKLSQNTKTFPILNEHISETLDEVWTKDDSWHTLSWFNDTTRPISRASASIFVGPELAKDREWQDLTVSYVANFFTACFALQKWPAWMRPVVHWFMPEARRCRKQMGNAQRFMKKESERRRHEEKTEDRQDAITWTEQAARGKPIDHASLQLGLAMAALFTTAESLRQTLLDLCQHQDLIHDLRKEISEAISENGLTVASLAKMHLLESVMKESQRHSPFLVGLERQATSSTRLPDGTPIPTGTVLMVDSSDMWNPEVHSSPETYDGYRFYKMREAGDKTTSFVSSTKEHNTFGGGRHICPGRFFAAVELKLCLVHVLMKWDLRLREGYVPEKKWSGVYIIGDMAAEVEVRRRRSDHTL